MNVPADQAQELLDTLQEQRNKAMNDAAVAMARSVGLQRELAAAREEIAKLKEKP